MRTIRQIWYENSIVDLCHKNQWNKEDAITLNAYLDSSKVETFQTLFPQYSDRLSKYAELVRDVVSEMVTLSKDLTNINASNTHVSNVAGNLLHEFTAMIKYNLSNKSDVEKSKAFSSFVLHPASLEFLLPVSSNTV